MKTIAWNSTDQEIQTFYDLSGNYDNLINRYLHFNTSILNSMKASSDPLRFRRVKKLRMKNIFESGKHSSLPFRKFTEWIEIDKENLISNRDNEHFKEQHTKDKVIECKDKLLLDAKATILDLQNQLNREKIKVKELQLNCEKLSLKKEPIIEYREPEEVSESIQEKDPYSMVTEPVAKQVVRTSFDTKKDIMSKELLKQYNETERSTKDRVEILDKFYDWLMENDEEDFEEDEECEIFAQLITAQGSVTEVDSDEDIF